MPSFAAEWRRQLITQQDMTTEELAEQGKRNSPRWDDAEFPNWVLAKQQARPEVLDWITSKQPTWIELLPKIMAPGLLITGDPELMTIINPDWASQAAARGRGSRWCGSSKRATTSAATTSTIT